MLKSLVRAVTPVRLRNEIRLGLGLYPSTLRSRFADLAMMDLPRKPVVFDVGANIGDFTECVLAYRPWAVLHLFEPLEECHSTLRTRFGALGDVAFNSFALGSTASEQAFRVRQYGQASSFLSNGPVADGGVAGLDFSESESRRVKVMTLQEYAADAGVAYIHLLKLDVQGYELEVLRGAEPALDRIDWIYAEAQFEELYAGGPMANDLFRFLHSRGFDLRRMTSVRADDQGNMMECDMIFRRRASE